MSISSGMAGVSAGAEMSERSESPPDNVNTKVPVSPRQQATSAPTAPHAEKAFFGALKQDAPRQQHPVFNDDYEERFPEDPYCEEIAPNARVWRTYVEEAGLLTRSWSDNLVMGSIQAGLFSAVVTSFLVQISQKLEADFSEMSAILMHDLVLVQLSMVAGSSGSNLTAPSVDPTMAFSPDTITVWINGLWAVSLAASLVVALAAVLVKQWLHHYTSLPSGTPGTRSHVRQLSVTS
ncbi:hypothetical protein BDZ89DRAFT_1135549 [Hymenopellis radicata]|nr:hypothetical protein BDZ89DRAFT_1135549 [Hymenopellis radicata]